MMHLIKKGNKYLVMASDIDTIVKYCGIDARILFSWKEEEQEEALKSFFSKVKIDLDSLELYVISGITRNEMNEVIEDYYEQNQVILSALNDIEVITPKEKDELSDISESSKKKQLSLVSESYLRNPLANNYKK